MSDQKEKDAVAWVFERASHFAEGGKRWGSRDSALGQAFSVAEALARSVAKLVQSMGPGEAKKLIDELVARRDEGIITDEHIATDNEAILTAVADMYRMKKHEALDED